ncbi:helix-turn-helix domain-containing protein [Paracoccus aminophilus]|uniref:helix-turn-helix domain-containing protein n=1 Tax=Paracoccus aminophilus TaxID=34003 RepID=UPI00041D60BB|nr:helix-turn-helix transcriptional regulator [Paracoccus aminophilus]
MYQPIRSSKDFGDLIRRCRQLAGLTQAELAQRAGLETKQISRIETATNVPGLNSILALCAALDIELGIRERDETGSSSQVAASIEDIF